MLCRRPVLCQILEARKYHYTCVIIVWCGLGVGIHDNCTVAADFNYDRESLGRSGSFRRANEQTLIKLISEGQGKIPPPPLSLSLRIVCTHAHTHTHTPVDR